MSNTNQAIAIAEVPSVFREYYELTKPGITQMVALTTVTGYYLAIQTDVLVYASNPSNWLHFTAAIMGTVLVSGGSCAINQVMERKNDAQMKRTAMRPIPAGTVSPMAATWFGLIISLIGVGLLAFTNLLTVLLAVATWLTYVAVYTPLKQRSSLAMLVGGIPGALPFAGGWTAVTGQFDMSAFALFAILFFWQMPHFLALSWMYRRDYQAGGYVLRALADESGRVVGLQMLAYSVLLLASLLLPTALGITGVPYTIGAILLGGWLIAESIRFRTIRDAMAARRVLLTSYAVLMGALVLMVIDKVAA